ncbi:MAG: hypothetical protein AB8B85_03380 [Paracoccaceae bacterium]
MSFLRVVSCVVAVGLLVFAAFSLRSNLLVEQITTVKELTADPVSDQPSAYGDLDRMIAGYKTVSIAKLAGANWQHACLSRGEVPPPPSMSDCWPAAEDRNLGGSYVSIRGPEGACSQWRTTRPVVHKRFEDSFCTARAELPTLTLRAKDKLVDIE